MTPANVGFVTWRSRFCFLFVLLFPAPWHRVAQTRPEGLVSSKEWLLERGGLEPQALGLRRKVGPSIVDFQGNFGWWRNGGFQRSDPGDRSGSRFSIVPLVLVLDTIESIELPLVESPKPVQPQLCLPDFKVP